MIGSERLLNKFVDYNGKIPKVGDLVVYSNRSFSPVYVNGVHKTEWNVKLMLGHKKELGYGWGIDAHSFEQRCIILNKHDHTIKWQFKK